MLMSSFGAGVVDEVFVVGGGGDEGGGGCVVELAGQAVGDTMQAGYGVVGEERFVSSGEAQVVAQVGLSCADVTGDHAEGVLDDAEVDAGDGFLVGGPGVEVGGRDGFAEGGAFEPEVGGPRGGR